MDKNCKRVLEKYPDRVPIIMRRRGGIKDLDRKKYLCPGNISCSQFALVIRNRIKLAPEEAIFLFTEDGTIPRHSDSLMTIYGKHKSMDGYLYITYCKENTFGCKKICL